MDGKQHLTRLSAMNRNHETGPQRAGYQRSKTAFKRVAEHVSKASWWLARRARDRRQEAHMIQKSRPVKDCVRHACQESSDQTGGGESRLSTEPLAWRSAQHVRRTKCREERDGAVLGRTRETNNRSRKEVVARVAPTHDASDSDQGKRHQERERGIGDCMMALSDVQKRKP